MKKSKLLTGLLTVATLTMPIAAVTSCTTTDNTSTQEDNASSYVKVTFSAGNTGATLTGETVFKVKSGKTFGTIVAPVATKSGNAFKYWCTDLENPSTTKLLDTTPINAATVAYPYFESTSKYDVVFYTDKGYFTKGGVEKGQVYVLHDVEPNTTLAQAFAGVTDIDLITEAGELQGLPKPYSQTGHTYKKFYTDANKVTKDTVVTDHMEISPFWYKEDKEVFSQANWNDIWRFANEYEKSEQDEDAVETLCSYFSDITYDSSLSKEENLAKFAGLEHSISVNEITQNVRIVGAGHDTIVDDAPYFPGKKAAFTFQFTNELCDKAGHSIATPWNNVKWQNEPRLGDDAAYDYTNSTLRYSLDGGGNAIAANSCLWTQRGMTHISNGEDGTMDLRNKTVLDMIVEGGSLTSSMLKTVNKYVETNNKTHAEEGGTIYWTDHSTKTFSAKVFLPTAHEIGCTDIHAPEEGDSKYDFYLTSTGSMDQYRITQISDNTTEYTNYPTISGFINSNAKNYAGYNFKPSSATLYAGKSWIGSPYVQKVYTETKNGEEAWYLSEYGSILTEQAELVCLGVVPCFCL